MNDDSPSTNSAGGAVAARLAMTAAYDGTAYQGWQVQPGTPTVQRAIEEAFGTLCGGTRPRIHGSGRTDTGVHARGQVFHVEPSRDYPPAKWVEALNGLLPPDIRILEARGVDPGFHARFSAEGKQYRYYIHNHPVLPPDLRLYRTHVRRPLRLEAMRRAAGRLVGTWDFTSFSAGRGGPEESAVRTLRRLELMREENGDLCLIAEADGFLYKMVRRLAGALIRAGLDELSPDDIQALLDRPERNHLAPTAPPRGLFLWRVEYPRGRGLDFRVR